jgi:hypothetical protein
LTTTTVEALDDGQLSVGLVVVYAAVAVTVYVPPIKVVADELTVGF